MVSIKTVSLIYIFLVSTALIDYYINQQLYSQGTFLYTTPWNLLFVLLNNIVFIIFDCVYKYLGIFKSIFISCLDALVILIYGYYDLLIILIDKFMVYPNIIYVTICLHISLYWIYRIIDRIWITKKKIN